ncbi:MAG: HesA/MoeB/ThiF family protein, partial [Fusobacteria bacterium]
ITNLNRQIISTEKNLGALKVIEAKKRINDINSAIEVVAINEKISLKNIENIIDGSDIVVDALDNSLLKKSIEKICAKNKIIMVHGAIAGFIGQVAVIRPGDFILDKIYREKEIENKEGNLSFTPALVSSIQVGEVVKILLNKGEVLENEILYIDLKYNTFTKIKI